MFIDQTRMLNKRCVCFFEVSTTTTAIGILNLEAKRKKTSSESSTSFRRSFSLFRLCWSSFIKIPTFFFLWESSESWVTAEGWSSAHQVFCFPKLLDSKRRSFSFQHFSRDVKSSLCREKWKDKSLRYGKKTSRELLYGTRKRDDDDTHLDDDSCWDNT